MSQLKKIDYRQLEEKQQGENSSQQFDTKIDNEAPGLAFLKSHWSFANRRTKIQVVFFLLWLLL